MNLHVVLYILWGTSHGSTFYFGSKVLLLSATDLFYMNNEYLISVLSFLYIIKYKLNYIKLYILLLNTN